MLIHVIALACMAQCINRQTPPSLDACKTLHVHAQSYHVSTQCNDAAATYNFTDSLHTLHALVSVNDTIFTYYQNQVSIVWSPARQRAKTITQANTFVDTACGTGVCSATGYDPYFSEQTSVELQKLVHQTLSESISTVNATTGTLTNIALLSKQTFDSIKNIRSELTQTNAEVQQLQNLVPLYNKLVLKMADLVRCNANQVTTYQQLLLNQKHTNIEQARETLAQCDDTLSHSQVTEAIDNSMYCTNHTLRRNLQQSYRGPSQSDVIAPGFFLTYAQCFQLHHLVTPSYCDNCCGLTNSTYGSAQCPSTWTAPCCTDYIADKIKKECEHFETLVNAQALSSSLRAITTQSNELQAQMAAVQTKADQARNILVQCNGEFKALQQTYAVNAEELLQIHHCQVLLTQEYTRIAKECIDARERILIPYYGIIVYGGSACISLGPNYDQPNLLKTWQCLLGGIISSLLATMLLGYVSKCAFIPRHRRAQASQPKIADTIDYKIM